MMVDGRQWGWGVPKEVITIPCPLQYRREQKARQVGQEIERVLKTY